MRKFIAARQSLLTAVLLVVGLGVWLLSGATSDSELDHNRVETTDSRDSAVNVRVRTLSAESVVQEVVLHGRTEPARTVWLRAEIEGRVVEIGAERGARVEARDLIVRIDVRDRPALLTQAKAEVKQRELRYEGSQELSRQNFQSETEVAEALAQLEAARADLIRMQIELSNASVRASFAGVLDQRPVEVGDYVSPGDAIARVLEQDPMLVTGHVAQGDVHQIKIGSLGTAELVTGQSLQGKVTYVASESDQETRTFRVELEIPNPDRELVSGVTGEIRIPTQTFTAHFVPPSLLSLNDTDELGVKVVNQDRVVEFHRAHIVRATTSGLWITGLPDPVRIITVGQGFVRAGDQVRSVDESEIEGGLMSSTRREDESFAGIAPNAARLGS